MQKASAIGAKKASAIWSIYVIGPMYGRYCNKVHKTVLGRPERVRRVSVPGIGHILINAPILFFNS